MKRKEKKHKREQEKENWKKKDIDLLLGIKTNLKLDTIINKMSMTMQMKVKNHLWKKKDFNLPEDRQWPRNNLKETSKQKLKAELQDMKLIMFLDMKINQTETNLSLSEEHKQMKIKLRTNWPQDKIKLLKRTMLFMD